ncbi:hypothetical protein UFOVP489_16 [uncultured Caudovirales phage]|uniref:Uncharacterized protein n=1 Tax=uncultured Caudovirales phage TaxID=2100421 RepID=A0A6J5MES3_9CAUD|nr:hypothetical protein UFOVP489_16 [uncultured Caudovirales phage]CAB4191002.1 hypothetical protein UFOVP1218_7 [uncultured Caudovirales phage]
MTLFNPIWKVTIGGVEYTTAILANLTIQSGRVNIYEQANAGYINLEIINLDQSNVPIQINDSLTVQLKDSTSTFVPIFGGSVVDVAISIAELGSVGFSQKIKIIALGALARLPKALTNGVLPKEGDGDQIYTILKEVLFDSWQEVPQALTWATYAPTTTWANAQNSGLGDIDRPGNYELAARSSERTDVYSLVSALATSGLGYIFENAYGQIGYADSTHRSQYLAANGYVELSANDALGSGLTIQQRAGDVRNTITLKYDATSSSEKSASDITSIGLYGELAQIITTTLHNAADAQDQADFYLSLRAYPQYNFNSITYELTNPEIDDSDRDNLINVFMGMPLSISNLPLNMSSGTYLGFVEGWTFSARYNQISVTLNLSPISFSLQAMRWNDVPVTEHWNTINPTLDWANATIVA